MNEDKLKELVCELKKITYYERINYNQINDDDGDPD